MTETPTPDVGIARLHRTGGTTGKATAGRIAAFSKR